MKRLFILALLALLAASPSGRADELDDQYIQVFNLIQEGDRLSADLPNQALTKYLQAQAGLQKLQKTDPKWNTTVVNFRLSYVAGQIALLAPKVTMPPGDTNNATPAATSPTPPNTPRTTAPPATIPVPKPAVPSDLDVQVRNLKGQVHQLQEDNGLLQSKLKEALALQPASVDPQELAKAQERIKSLQKENELLRVGLEREKTKTAPPYDPKALELSQQALADEKALTAKLSQERDALQGRLKALGPEVDAATALRAENQLIKKELSDLQANINTANAKATESARQMTEAQTQIAALESDREILRLEKGAVEERFRQLNAARLTATNAPAAPPVTSFSTSVADTGRIKALERERDDLQKKLDAANKDLYGRKGKAASARVDELETQLTIVRARLAVFEARSVPYSAEELALLKPPEIKPVAQDTNARKKPLRQLPAGSATLVAEAQTYFASRQFDKAEEAYQQVLKQDKKSIPALANLAAIQVEAQHYDAADANLKQALALDPQDAYTMYVLGLLRFRQQRFDDALDAFSQAAKADPENAEIQNYLGLTLSEKGMRGPAEAALRKAVELQPNYARAHYNLAVFYATQKPPYPALARWHYEKARAAGHPAYPEIEKLLEEKP
jgi:tetratricopeptide (TPR) repeat protein